MCVTKFREKCNKYKIYHFDTIDDFHNWIDYDWIVIDKNKYISYDIIENPSGIPTYIQWYWLK